MASVKTRIERLMAEAKKITWKPHMIFLVGKPGDYTLIVDEWDGVPGSARGGDHRKQFRFKRKIEAMDFADTTLECAHRYDLSILTAEELHAIRPRTVLEEQAEREGKTLHEKVLETFGYVPVFWAGILENDTKYF